MDIGWLVQRFLGGEVGLMLALFSGGAQGCASIGFVICISVGYNPWGL